VNLHTQTNTPGARHRRKRVGRGKGSGLGKTSGRGQKGQLSRSGHKRKPGFEGGQMRLVRRIPKRGFTNINRKTYVAVNIAALDRFDDGAVVDVEALKSAGLAKAIDSGVKILGGGEITKKLTVKADAFSATARSKIEAAGGVCEIA
jgi:large subunit ribosomal protein L15